MTGANMPVVSFFINPGFTSGREYHLNGRRKFFIGAPLLHEDNFNYPIGCAKAIAG